MARNRKNDIKFHEEMKQASIAVYNKKGASMPEGYVRKGEPIENKSNGFYAEVWQKENDIVIVYRGTDDPIDGINDIAMARKNIPAQATDALALHDKIKRENKNCDISVTGHSLGGSLAQIVGSIRGTFATTFNAYGTKDMYKDSQNLKTDNIVNYVNEFDYIGMANAENNVGDTYSVKQTHLFDNPHNVESFSPLTNRIYKTSDELKKMKLKDIKDKITNKIKNVNSNLSSSISSKLDSIRKSSENSHSIIKQCIGSYQVSGYTREDGTEVQGYTRTCGAKHEN